MTEENAQSTTDSAAEASAKKGGIQFIIKMIFLALIVLAIVFYVRSLDHKTPSSATTVPSQETTPVTSTAEEPAPAAAEITATETAPPPVTAPKPAEADEAPPAVEAVTTEETASAEAGEVVPPVMPQDVEEPRFRPVTEEEVLRQIQEVFAPETVEQAPAE
jgi:hypothetical protein